MVTSTLLFLLAHVLVEWKRGCSLPIFFSISFWDTAAMVKLSETGAAGLLCMAAATVAACARADGPPWSADPPAPPCMRTYSWTFF